MTFSVSVSLVLSDLDALRTSDRVRASSVGGLGRACTCVVVLSEDEAKHAYDISRDERTPVGNGQMLLAQRRPGNFLSGEFRAGM